MSGDSMKKSDLIKVIQAPIIEQKLKDLSAEIESKTNAAISFVVTEDSVGSAKKIRAELNREFQEFEALRKAVKEAIEAPYNQFNYDYKEYISRHYTDAESSLKSQINAIEGEIKEKCRESLQSYFSELCAVNHLEWLRFESADISIDMTVAKSGKYTKLKKQLSDFVKKVGEDVEAIKGMNDSAEIFAEYQNSLKLSDSVSIVTERHKQIEKAQKELECKGEKDTIDNEVERKVEILSAPTMIDDQILICEIKIKTTKDKLIKAKRFFDSEGIEYE